MAQLKIESEMMNKPTIKELEAALKRDDLQIFILPSGEVQSQPSRFADYRDLLERWMGWWRGPAADFGLQELSVIPPVTDTVESLKCMICQGITADGERCAACGRELNRT